LARYEVAFTHNWRGKIVIHVETQWLTMNWAKIQIYARITQNLTKH